MMRAALVAVFGLSLLAAATFAAAGSFSISPIGLTIENSEGSGSITATNTGDAAIVVQVKAFKWTQHEGKDSVEDTRALLINPPVFRLIPGEQQLVRVAPRAGPPKSVEDAYRLVFTEIVSKDAPASKQTGLRLAVAHNMPVYVAPVAGPTRPRVTWRAERTDLGVRVSVENGGSGRYRIEDVEVFAGSAKEKRAVLVVLPNSRMSFELAAPQGSASPVRIKAQDDAGRPVTIDIPLDAAR